MTCLPKHFFRSRNGRRGSVIVLVVAVLALLAVIGTVYIVSSRAGRSAAASGNASENLENARDAVNTQIINLVGNPMFGADGNVGGRTAIGSFGYRQFRRFDMPEFNVNHPGFSVSDQTGNPTLPDESWLAADLYPPAVTVTNFNLNINNLTMPQTWRTVTNLSQPTYYSPTVFDPTTGTYDIPLLGAPLVRAAQPAFNFFRVVPDPGALQIVSLPYPDGTSYAYQNDALVQMLPFSEAGGTRYRFGLRIIDSSAMANLNVGDAQAPALNPAALASLFDAQKNNTYFNGYLLANAAFSDAAANAASLNYPGGFLGQASNPGRFGTFSPPNTMPLDYSWGQALFRLENSIRLSGAQASRSFWEGVPNAAFDFSDELALRSYGNLGTTAAPRAASIWPITFVNNPGNRSFYTTYSYSRDIRPDTAVAGTPYGLLLDNLHGHLTGPNPGANNVIWPTYPACVNINPDVSTYTQWVPSAQATVYASDELVMAAVNTAQAMSNAGFTPEEQLAFVANYLTFRWNTWQKTTVKNGPSAGQVVYTLPAGPSLVDGTGPCLRNGSQSDYASDLHAANATTLYLGYAAQPFLNEVAVHQVKNPPPAMGSSIDECAIQLYNPYDVALSLADFELVWGAGATNTHVFSADDWIPARGFFVLTQNGWTGGIDAAAQKLVDANFQLTVSTQPVIYLKRKFYPRNVPAGQFATVDQYDAHVIVADQTATNPQYYELSRANSDATPTLIGTTFSTISRWIAVIHTGDSSSSETQGTTTLGTAYPINVADAGSISQPVPLYDRVIELVAADLKAGITADNSPTYDQQLLANIADFNRVMRICNEIDLTTPDNLPVAAIGPIPAQLWSKSQLSAISSDHPFDANIHFDFRPDPFAYSPGASGTPPAIYKVGDSHAAALLEYLTLTDRVSDYTIDLGDNVSAGGISKIRIPGRINVNTASAQVLDTIPVLAANPKLIGYILAYRWRTSTNDQRIPLLCQPGTLYNFNTPDFPGYGIRTMAELQIPLAVAQTAAGLTNYPTIYDRDQFWGQMYNSLTVRSDTFIAYAYLEAVRLNPRYPANNFDNASNWYATTTSPGIGVTDDPNDSTHALLRIARRRWVAVVDRSQANFNRMQGASPDLRFTQAQIVAQKDLPR